MNGRLVSWTLGSLLALGCAGLPASRDAVGVSHLLPLADPMGPDETAVGLCVGSISEPQPAPSPPAAADREAAAAEVGS